MRILHPCQNNASKNSKKRNSNNKTATRKYCIADRSTLDQGLSITIYLQGTSNDSSSQIIFPNAAQ